MLYEEPIDVKSDRHYVFFTCSEHAGSDLTSVLLDAHAEIVAPRPLNVMRDTIALSRAMAFGDHQGPVAQSMLASVFHSLSRQVSQDIATRIVTAAADVRPFTPREIMRLVYGALGASTGARHLVIREAGLLHIAAQLLDTFPDARFILQIRDPRDWVASRVLKDRNGGRISKGALRAATLAWADEQRFGLGMLGHFGPGRVFLLRYEDLVARPENVLQALCDFLGLPFSDSMLSVCRDETAPGAPVENNIGEASTGSVVGGGVTIGRAALNQRQTAEIVATLGPQMAQLGYGHDLDPSDKRQPQIWPALTGRLWRAVTRERSFSPPDAGIGCDALPDRNAAPLQLTYLGAAASAVAPGQIALDLPSRLLAAARDHAANTALRIDGEDWSYDRLFGAALALAAHLPQGRPVVGILAARHASAYIGILAALLAGGTYVPLNCRFPAARNRDILKRSGAQVLVHGAVLADPAAEILAGLCVPGLLAPEDAPPMSQCDWQPRIIRFHDPAYIMFTSGSTGLPKGVSVSHRNLAAYVAVAAPHMSIQAEDRFSQTFDLTFDLSVHDMMLAWSHGATLCVPLRADLLQPGAWLKREAITHWFSVPSLAYTARQTGALAPGGLPSVRNALFCGEALPSDLAAEFQAACPQARVENWYGPTEATIAILRHPLAAGGGDGVVPIGVPFAGAEALVLDDEDRDVPDGEIGTLFLGGPQVVGGYLEEPELSKKAFRKLPGRGGLYYNTGDRVSRGQGGLHFHGRRDDQAKIRGYRVELGEVETALRGQSGGCPSVALAWPPGAPSASHIVAALETLEPKLDRAALATALPDYMVPSSVFGFERFPKNASGKVDRDAIAREIAARIAAREVAAGDSLSDRLLATILALKPTLDPEALEHAESLLLAGLDSMDFVNLTLALEQKFGLVLSEERVALMANLRLSDLADFLVKGRDAKTALATLPAERMVRANRALAFLEKAPALLRQAGPPLVLAFGSSGTMRGIVGGPLADGEGLMINLGLPALTQAGLARMARHVAELCAGREIRAILHELDPMLVSTVPPKGDVTLTESIYAGAGLTRRVSTEGEFGWEPAHCGTLILDSKAMAKLGKRVPQPAWQGRRNTVIASVYRGEVPFDEDAVAHWIAADDALAALDGPVLGWVHPLAQGDVGGGLYDAMLTKVIQATNRPILSGADIPQLPVDLFLNINHMRPGTGAQALTDGLLAALHKWERATGAWQKADQWRASSR